MVYVKLPPNTVIAPHTHPYADVVTVLKGNVGNGHGKEFDKSGGKMLGAGSTFVLPAGHAHFLWNEEEVIALLTATGPRNINYVNAADDPRIK
ncbi:MAG: cupin domain-containing protein [Pseudomonadota bacterium]